LNSGGRGQLFVALGALALLGAVSLLPPAQFFLEHVLLAMAAGVLAVWALARAGAAAGVALVGFGLCAGSLVRVPWPLVMPLALAFLAVCTRLRPEVGAVWFTRGSVPPAATIVCGAVTPIALLSWLALTRPDLSDFAALVPKVRPWLLIFGGVGFAACNATLEECIWRGVIQTRLTTMMSEPWAIVVQAISFGVAHAHGFPRGFSGMLLAGIWALMLGALRMRSSGLLAPIVAHFVADATIAAVLLRHAL
jgi:membrane protease YdiL (CAAX protease family)